jgi:hypothetical protein
MQVRYFYPSKGFNSRKLEGYDLSLCKILSSVIYLYDGQIDPDKFYLANQNALENFQWFFGSIKEKKDGIYAEYISSGENDNSKDSFIQLEIQSFSDKIFSIQDDMQLYLPKKMSRKEKNQTLVYASPNGVKFFNLSLTILKYQTVVGVTLNHSLTDFSALAYYFQCVSRFYTKGIIDLDKPSLVSRYNIMGEEKIKSLSDFNALKPGFFTKKPPFPDSSATYDAFLELNLNKFDEYKKKSASKVSTNDLLNAVLLKCMVKKSKATDNDLYFKMFNAADMRKYLGLPKYIIGDLMYTKIVQLTRKQIIEHDLAELAVLVREQINTLSGVEYQLFMQWCDQLPKYAQKAYYPDFAYNPSASQVVNNSNYSFSQLDMGDIKLVTILPSQAHRLPGTYFFVTKWVDQREEKKLVFLSSHYKRMLSQIHEVADEFGLFNFIPLPKRKRTKKFRMICIFIEYFCIKFFRLFR